MAFTFIPFPVETGTKPTPVYLVQPADEYEACFEKGIRAGVVVIMVRQMNGSPQGVGSKWVITNYRRDIDRITVQPLGAKAGLPVRNITLACFQRDFEPTGLMDYRVKC